MDLIKELHESRKKILCTIVLDKVGEICFERFSIGIRRLLSAGLLFIVLEITELFTLIFIHEPLKPIFISTLISAFAASISFYVVCWCYQYTVDQTEASLRKSSIGNNVERKLIDQIRKLTNLRNQILTSIVSTLLVLSILYVIQLKIGPPFNCNTSASFVTIGFASLGMGQGGYWAIFLPFLTTILRNGDISEIVKTPLYPEKTPYLIAVSKIYSAYAMWDSFMVTLCLIGLFALGIRTDQSSFLNPIFLIILGYMITSWTFLYPQYNIAKIIKRSKDDTLLQIEHESQILYKKIDKMQNSDFERLKLLMELHKNVSKGSIAITGLWSYISSMVTPTLVAVVSTLIKNSYIKNP